MHPTKRERVGRVSTSRWQELRRRSLTYLGIFSSPRIFWTTHNKEEDKKTAVNTNDYEPDSFDVIILIAHKTVNEIKYLLIIGCHGWTNKIRCYLMLSHNYSCCQLSFIVQSRECLGPPFESFHVSICQPINMKRLCLNSECRYEIHCPWVPSSQTSQLCDPSSYFNIAILDCFWTRRIRIRQNSEPTCPPHMVTMKIQSFTPILF